MLTQAQEKAVSLARRCPIRYYKGGWYSIPDVAGDDQQRPRQVFSVPSVHRTTLNALVKAGVLVVTGEQGDIYERRWKLKGVSE